MAAAERLVGETVLKAAAYSIDAQPRLRTRSITAKPMGD
jgi:hypothetical protein